MVSIVQGIRSYSGRIIITGLPLCVWPFCPICCTSSKVSNYSRFITVANIATRHWAILLASTITLLLTLIVVPFQSAMFNTATLTRKVETEMRTSGALLPLEQQSAALNYNMYFDIFGIVWNKQKTLP